MVTDQQNKVQAAASKAAERFADAALIKSPGQRRVALDLAVKDGVAAYGLACAEMARRDVLADLAPDLRALLKLAIAADGLAESGAVRKAITAAGGSWGLQMAVTRLCNALHDAGLDGSMSGHSDPQITMASEPSAMDGLEFEPVDGAS